MLILIFLHSWNTLEWTHDDTSLSSKLTMCSVIVSLDLIEHCLMCTAVNPVVSSVSCFSYLVVLRQSHSVPELTSFSTCDTLINDQVSRAEVTLNCHQFCRSSFFYFLHCNVDL